MPNQYLKNLTDTPACNVFVRHTSMSQQSSVQRRPGNAAWLLNIGDVESTKANSQGVETGTQAC